MMTLAERSELPGMAAVQMAAQAVAQGVRNILGFAGGVENSTVSFFFQAEDGIRDLTVTGVQTCALPIWTGPCSVAWAPASGTAALTRPASTPRARWDWSASGWPSST